MLIKDIIILEQRFKGSDELFEYLFNKAVKERIFGGKLRNLFLHFTNIPKIGFNPSSEFDTPLGFYSYPFDYVYESYLLTQKMYKKNAPFDNESYKRISMKNVVPFGGNRKYIIAFSINQQGVKLLQDFTESEFEKNLRNIINFPEIKKIENELGEEFVVEKIIDKSFVDSEIDAEGDVGKKFWYFVYNVCKSVRNYKSNIRLSLLSRRLFMFLGYKGFVDLDGGIIHKNRPTQSVIFDLKVIKDYRLLLNKTYFNKKSSIDKTDIKNTEQFKIAKFSIEKYEKLLHTEDSERKKIIEFIGKTIKDENVNSINFPLRLVDYISSRISNTNPYFKSITKKKKEIISVVKNSLVAYFVDNVFSDYFIQDFKIKLVPDIVGKGDEDEEFLLDFYTFLIKSSKEGIEKHVYNNFLNVFKKTDSFKKLKRYIESSKKYEEIIDEYLTKEFEGGEDYKISNIILKYLKDFYEIFVRNTNKNNLFDDIVEFLSEKVYYHYFYDFEDKALLNIVGKDAILEEIAKKMSKIITKYDVFPDVLSSSIYRGEFSSAHLETIKKAFLKNEDNNKIKEIIHRIKTKFSRLYERIFT